MHRCTLVTGSLLLLCGHPALAATPTIIPLDGVPNAATVTARSITPDTSTIVGGNALGGEATVWTKTGATYAPQLLPKTPGLDDAFANAINPAGTIAGYQIDFDGIPTATVWQRAGAPNAYTATTLPLPSGAVGASAFAINSAGTIAGFGVTAAGHTLPVLWHPIAGGDYLTALLPTPPGASPYAVATAINDSGLVAGYGAVAGNTVPVVWENGTPKAAYVVKSAAAAAINNHGIGAGVDDSGTDSSPLVLAPFEGDYYGAALPNSGLGGNGASNWVNDNDVLVGYTVDPLTPDVLGKEAALWLPTDIYWDYLNLDAWFRDQDPAAGAQWTLREANFITDTNWILGDATYDPDGPTGPLDPYDRSFLLDASTVPEPTALPLIALLVIVRRRRK